MIDITVDYLLLLTLQFLLLGVLKTFLVADSVTTELLHIFPDNGAIYISGYRDGTPAFYKYRRSGIAISILSTLYHC